MKAKEFLLEVGAPILPPGKEPMGMDPKPIQQPQTSSTPKKPVPGKSTPKIPPINTQPAEQPPKKVYADIKQVNQAIAELTPLLKGATLKNQANSGAKQVRHIRIVNASGADVNSAFLQWGATSSIIDSAQRSVSGTYLPLSFEKDGITYTVVATGKGAGSIAKKALTPTELGLAIKDKKYSRTELISATQAAVKKHIKDQSVATMLDELINIASNQGKGSLTPDSKSALAEIYNFVNQDFGEILAPIIMMNDNDRAEFPASGNNALVDVSIGNKKYSIKSLAGSGTSFRSIAELMDRFESSIVQDKHKKELYKPLAEFHPNKGGNNLDKIIRACNVARTPEYTEIIKTLGVQGLTSFGDLKKVLAQKIKNMNYKTFLSTFEKASRAGGWKKYDKDELPQMLGFPKDSAYVLGYTEKKYSKQGGSAGEPSYVADAVMGGSNILVYIMGKGLEFYIQRGTDAGKYKSMMTDIVNKSESELGHININQDGSMTISVQSFSTLDFIFQYHAPSDKAGNNLPGFAIVRN